MGNFKVDSATYSNLSNVLEDVTVSTRNTDGATNQDETEYINANWSKWFGYYTYLPEVKTAIDMRAIWTIGNGYSSDIDTTVILDHISGWGNDTFNSILKNMIVVKRIGGDAFAEIIRDPDSGVLINLKPLDPGSIKIIVDKKGILKRYEQINKVSKNKEIIATFKPEEILHFCNKRVADQIHGVSDIEAIQEIILANAESFVDMKKVMHRFVKPMHKFILDTDEQTKIDALVVKFDAAVNKGENIYIPKGTVEQELISIPSNATLNPLPWREHLRNYFYQVVGIPQIIMGGSSEFSESASKISYLAFEQSVDDEQNDIEAQIWNQLQLKIELSFPASLRNEMLSDEAKDGASKEMGFQPSDMIAGAGK
jgi:hypothetical protein